MADAQVADAAREAATPPEEPLSEDETCIDSGAFKRHHGFTTGPPGKRVYLDILKAMGKEGLEKTTLALLPKGGDSAKSKWLYEHLDSNAALKRRLLKYRHDAIKVWNKDRRAEQEESDEASSDDEAPAPVEPRRSTRQGAGELKAEQKRCGECDACLSLVRPPPGCTCPVCQGTRKATVTCYKVYQAKERGLPCEKLAQANLPEIGVKEEGSRSCGDPTTRERLKLQDVAELIRENSDADLTKLAANSRTEQGTTALLNLAVPGMPSRGVNVLRSLGEDATTADLGEYVAEHLRKLDYFEEDEETRNEMIRLARAAAIAPDVEPEPPANRSIMHRRAWERIAKTLYRQQRDEILALPKGSDALTTWLRKRAQFAVDTRREQGRIAGALADSKFGLAAAGRALRENRWTEKSKGERYNNTEPFRLARDETGRTDVTDNVARLRETGPPPPSSRKKKK